MYSIDIPHNVPRVYVDRNDSYVAPKSPAYILISSEGVWKVAEIRSVGFGIRAIEQIPCMRSADPSKLGSLKDDKTRMEVGKIPYEIYAQATSFMETVAKRYDSSESMLDLFYNPTIEKWGVQPPTQTVSRGSVNFVSRDAPSGWQWKGAWHSHGAMEPYYSRTDDRGGRSNIGELDVPGIYIVSGDFSQLSTHTTVFSVVNGGMRVMVNSSDLLEEPKNGVEPKH